MTNHVIFYKTTHKIDKLKNTKENPKELRYLRQFHIYFKELFSYLYVVHLMLIIINFPFYLYAL